MLVIKDFPDVVSAIPRNYLQHAIFALLLAICGPVLYSRKKHRSVPGVPIFGIEESGGLARARENFCADAKTMLTEGYQRVYLLSILISQNCCAKQIKVQISRPVLYS